MSITDTPLMTVILGKSTGPTYLISSVFQRRKGPNIDIFKNRSTLNNLLSHFRQVKTFFLLISSQFTTTMESAKKKEKSKKEP